MTARLCVLLAAVLLTAAGCGTEREGSGGFRGTGIEPSPDSGTYVACEGVVLRQPDGTEQAPEPDNPACPTE